MTTHTYPAGSKVRSHNGGSTNGKIVTVLDPDASLDSRDRTDSRRSTREFVQDDRGIRWWLPVADLTPVPTIHPNVTNYPVGTLVRDAKYPKSGIGTVTGHHPTNPSYDNMVVDVQFDANATYTAKFPDPDGRLERVHVLTHDELLTLDKGARTGIPADEEDAASVLDKHLRPTVKRTFTVTAEAPTVEFGPIDKDLLRQVFGSTDVKVTITEETNR